MAGVLIEAAALLFGLVVLFAWVVRLTRTRRVVALICPACGGRTALTPSRPAIDCRFCRMPLRRGGALCGAVEQEPVRLFGRG